MSVNIKQEIHEDFLVYAKEVNQNRSFPDVRDGLKPSQRAALWEMFDKGYSSDKPHVKSAKVTGGIIANWWPHGDNSAYELIVRMSQDWLNNIPEVSWHGANGSQLGGPQAASSRYTECRLTETSEDGFFSNIKQNTVDMIPNFSEDDEWPSVFPAIFPRLIVNGSQGIGYTIAQEWEPTNLNEFTVQVRNYLTKGKIDYNKIAPDYPTGGIIINKNNIPDIYKTGKGSITIRGKVDIEGNTIKITELPYQVYAEPFIQKVKDLVNSEDLTGIEDICNKSDDNGLLIEIECESDPKYIVNKLYKLTELQSTFSANMMALINGEPQLLTLKDYIKEYVDHNINCIIREYKFNLQKAQDRAEIVDGLLRALSIIDQIIDTIKSSKSSVIAKENLNKSFDFTDNQAKAIIDMRLGKLANLEVAELEKESKELKSTIKKCKQLLSSEIDQQTELINRLTAFTKKYGWERRTELAQVDIVAEKQVVKEKKKDLEQYIITLNKSNCINKIKLVDYRPQTKVKNEADRIINAIKMPSNGKVILISNTGKMYKLPVNKIAIGSNTSSGISLEQLFNDNIIAMYSGSEEEKYILMLTKNGKGKKIASELVFSIGKNVGTPIMKLDDSDMIIDCRLINSEIIKVTVDDKSKKIDTDTIKEKGKSAGGVTVVRFKNSWGVI